MTCRKKKHVLFLSILEIRYATYVECDVKRAFSYIVRTCVDSLPNTAGIPSLGAEPLACAGRAIYLAVMHESCPKKGKIFSATCIKKRERFWKVPFERQAAAAAAYSAHGPECPFGCPAATAYFAKLTTISLATA